MRTIAQPTVSVNSASDALLAANARLLQLRENAATNGSSQQHPAAREQIESRTSNLVTVGEAVLIQRRLAVGVGDTKSQATRGRGSFLVIPTIEEHVHTSCDSAESPAPNLHPTDNSTFLRMYPDLLLGMLRQEQVAIGRIWLLCRHLDTDGRGWLDLAFVREQLTAKTSPLKVVGKRRLRQILADGAGVFWKRDDFGRLWLYGVARVAAGLGIERFANRPIALPIADLVASLAQTRAHCYAAFHSGRSVPSDSELANPISRATLSRLCGIAERTQRRYDDLAGVVTRPCIAIGAIYAQENHTETVWQHGGTFKLTDYRGLHGQAGQSYSAWQLPNQYQGCHHRLPKGRQRKLNLQLRLLTNNQTDLVTQRARGNSSALQTDKVERITFARRFFADGGTAIKMRTAAPIYWGERASTHTGVWIAVC